MLKIRKFSKKEFTFKIVYVQECFRRKKKKKSIYWFLSVYFEYIVVDAKKEKNNRMGRTRDLFKKIRDTKGKFYAKIGSIKTEMVWT